MVPPPRTMVAFVEDGGLSWGSGALGLVEGDGQLVNTSLLGHRRHRVLAVVSLHQHLARTLPNVAADEVHIASHYPHAEQLVLKANNEPIGERILPQHVQRFARRYADALALPDGVADEPRVLPEHAPFPIHDLPRIESSVRATAALDEPRIVAVGHEADVLLSASPP